MKTQSDEKPGAVSRLENLDEEELTRLLLEFSDDQLARRFWVPLEAIRGLRSDRLGETAVEPEPPNPSHDV